MLPFGFCLFGRKNMFFIRFVDFVSIFGKMKKTERAAMF